MSIPDFLAILGLIISSIIFYMYARGVNKEKLTLDGFMLSDRTLNKVQFSNTFAASSFSLAIATMYFFFNHKTYGLFLLVSPITFFLGQYFFVWLVKKAQVNFEECRTISDLCYKIYPNKSVARLITCMTLSSFIMAVFIELYIGTVIFTIFLPDNIFYQTLSFLLMGSLVLMYVRLGGYKALVRTDTWQLALMIMSVSLIVVYGILAPTINGADLNKILLSTLEYQEEAWPLLGFVVWLSLLNFLLPFTQVSYWQRIAASKTTEISLKGLIHSCWKVLVLFSFPTFGFILLGAKGYTFDTFPAFLETVKYTNWLTGYIIFPLLIVGFCSMIFSSADTAIIAITYSLSDQNTFLKSFKRMNEKKLRQTLVSIITLILIILSIIYWLQFTGLQKWLVPIIYAISGQLAVLTPLPMYILIQLSRGRAITGIRVNRKTTFLLFNGILLSWFVLLLGTYLSKVTTYQLWSQLSVPLGAFIVGFITWKIYKLSVLAQKNYKDLIIS